MTNKWINTIKQGHCLELLKQMDSESINCIITSPPYWGLRNYSTSPQIWEPNSNCQHEWKSIVKQGMSGGNKSKMLHIKNYVNFQAYPDQNQLICEKCGAWQGELGQEPNINMYIEHLIQVFNECKRVLKKDGTMWINIDDSYGGNCSVASNGGRSGFSNEKEYIHKRHKTKSLSGVPFSLALQMIENGWLLRNTIIWKKTNPMPQSAKDRYSNNFEYVFFFVKNRKYYFNQQKLPLRKTTYERAKAKCSSMKNDMQDSYISSQNASKLHKKIRLGIHTHRNMRCVWNIATQSFGESHFATFPEKLVKRCLTSGCPVNGIVLDPFIGSGTAAVVSQRLGMDYIGLELNEKYIQIANRRINLIKPSKYESFQDFKDQYYIGEKS